MPNGIEVRVLDAPGSMKDTFIQSMPELKNARHLARSKKGLLFAASVSQLYCIQMTDIQKQCKSLMKEKKFQLALQLTVTPPPLKHFSHTCKYVLIHLFYYNSGNIRW